MYTNSNKRFVLAYLNQRYLPTKAHYLFDTQSITPVDQVMIEASVLPKPLNVNRELINDANFVSHATRYLTRKYGPIKAEGLLQSNTVNDVDFKTIESMCKLKTAYTAIRNKRVQTVVIAYKEDPNFSSIAPKTKAESAKPKPAKKTSNKVPVCLCKAIKMDGQPCGAKAKNGTYCARHSKKN
jgi:hypothetical protein